VRELAAYYAAKASPAAYLPRLAAAAAELSAKGQPQLALALHQQALALLDGPAAQGERRLAAEQLAAHRAAALFGAATCGSALALAEDPAVRQPGTLDALLAELLRARGGLALLLPHERLHAAVYNGSVCLHRLAAQLLRRGFTREAFPHLLFAAKSLEADVAFCSPTMLRWRLQLYSALVHCYRALAAQQLGRQVLEGAREQIAQLRRWEAFVALGAMAPRASLASHGQRQCRKAS
jgi:hypothetical protein